MLNINKEWKIILPILRKEINIKLVSEDDFQYEFAKFGDKYYIYYVLTEFYGEKICQFFEKNKINKNNKITKMKLLKDTTKNRKERMMNFIKVILIAFCHY